MRCQKDLRIPLQTRERTDGHMDVVPTTVIIGPSVCPSGCLPEAITRRARPDRTFREQRPSVSEDYHLRPMNYIVSLVSWYVEGIRTNLILRTLVLWWYLSIWVNYCLRIYNNYAYDISLIL